MYGDFSRLRIGEAHEFAAIWSQQGRVQLDSDANEMMAIFLDHLRSLTVDVLGPFAAGYPGTAFKIELCPDDETDLLVYPGDYYVHGLRCRLADPWRPGSSQPSRYRRHAGPAGSDELPPPPYLVELVVWEQTRSAVQDTRLLEPALGPTPPDTTLRTVVRFALQTRRHLPSKGDTDLSGDESRDDVAALFAAANAQMHTQRSGRPLLMARAYSSPDPGPDTDDVPYEQGYRRPENQLYRIEIRTGGKAGTATYAWSRDNGSILFSVASIDSSGDDAPLVAQLSERARDQHLDLDEDDWVELCHDDRSPLTPVSPLLQVRSYDRGRGLVTLAGPRSFKPAMEAGSHPFLRRWDQRPDVFGSDNAIPIPVAGSPGSEGWADLEDGVQVQFCDPDAIYKPGDYWLVPARSATGGVLWPTGDDGRPRAVHASRPLLHHAPLAMVLSDGVVDLRGSRPHGPARTAYVTTESGQRVRVEVVEGDEAYGHGSSEYVAAEAEQGGVAMADATYVAPKVPSSGSDVSQAATSSLVVGLTVLDYEPQPGAELGPVPAGKKFFEGFGTHSIGRAEGSRIQLDDSTVSRTHATLSIDEDSCRVWDTGTAGAEGSVNGTYLTHGKDPEVAITESAPVADGDVLRVGAVRLLVTYL